MITYLLWLACIGGTTLLVILFMFFVGLFLD